MTPSELLYAAKAGWLTLRECTLWFRHGVAIDRELVR